MSTRLFTTVIAAIVALIGIVISPVIDLWGNYNDKTDLFDLLFTLIATGGLAALIVSAVSLIKDNDDLFIKTTFIAGIAFITAILIFKLFSYNAFTMNGNELPYYYLILISSGVSFILALDAKLEDPKATIAMSSLLVGVLSFIYLPVISVISGLGLFGELNLSYETTYDLLFHIGELNTLLILFVVLAFAGIIAVVVGVVLQLRGDEDKLEDILVLAGVLTIAATTLFLTNVSFQTEYLGSGVYLMLFSGVGYLTTGILSKKGNL